MVTDRVTLDWHEIKVQPTVLKIVAQSSSRVFLGEELCRNPDWLRITVDYTVDSVVAAQTLRLWPKILRPVVHWFLPSCQKIRAQIFEARALVNPVLEKRHRAKAALLEQGKTPERYPDAMEWFEETSKGRPYDPAISQLMLSLAAIHTTSNMMTQVIFDLSKRENLVQALREEIISVIKEDGWRRTTIYKLKLMDSVLKESLRIKPPAIGL